MYVHQVVKKTKRLKEPNNHKDYNHDVEDFLNGIIHWNIGVDEPKKNANDNQN
jgi:hypothetical protein